MNVKAVAALIFAVVALCALFHAVAPYSTPHSLIITEVYPNTAQEQDEYVAITNPCTRSIKLEGWSITDKEGKIIFPSFRIAPGDTLYVTRNASAFVEQRSSVTPEFEYDADSNPEVGMILKRKGNGDSDTADDWVILFFDACYHAPEAFSISGMATAFVSPDCSFAILQHEIANASSSLFINVYEFTNPELMELVLDALNRGVKVQLLLDGAPVGGISDDELCIGARIKERCGEVRFSDDPYINHAKYAIIDGKKTILMSENWKRTGVPLDNSFGNRGWGIVIRDEAIANYFKAVFADDFRRGTVYSTETGSCSITRKVLQGSYVPVFVPLAVNSKSTVVPVLAPDSALCDETILGMINNAQERVYVQQFAARRVWGEDVSPFIAAIIEAARRGCEVKVLLDSKYLEGANNNDELVSWLNEKSTVANLSLEARLADLKSLGLAKVHNKGLIVDNDKVLISSLNWNANSGYNREAGVIVENAEIAGYYEQVFLYDWNASACGPQKVGKEGTSTAMRIVYLALTLVLVFALFWLVKWYKRV